MRLFKVGVAKIRQLLDEKNGFIMIMVYGLISIMAILSLALFSRQNIFLLSSERNRNRLIAFNMAEAGLDRALTQLAVDPTYAGTGFNSMSSGPMEGGFDVTVSTPAGQPTYRLVTANGYAPSNTATTRGYETRRITAYAQLGNFSYFDFAVFSEEGMQINGNPVIDSYDSRNGPYGGANTAQNGDIGTDSVGSGTVALIGNATVKGDAQVGPNGNPNSVVSIGTNASISGSLSAATAERDYQPETTNIVSLGDLNIKGNTTQFLAAGTYRYSSFSIAGNGQLVATGPVVIYVDGPVNIAGNGVSTQNNTPPNFLLYVTTSDDVKLAGNGNFYGGIYAPASDVKNTGNGELYGAVVSQDYQQSGNGAVHYDEALRNTGGSSNAGVNLVSWREENTAAWGTGTAYGG